MATPERWIVKRRCDVPMKRSKEKAWNKYGRKWRCNHECKTCICCIYMTNEGNEYHVNPLSRGNK